MADLSVTVVWFVTFALALLIVRLYIKRKNYPPGPHGFPIFGHLPMLGANPLKSFSKWISRYGDIFRIRMGSWDTVILNGYDLIKEAFERTDDVFSARPDFYMGKIFTPKATGVASLAGFNKDWNRQRRTVINCIRPFMSTKGSVLQEIIGAELDLFGKSVESMSCQKVSIDKPLDLLVGSILYQTLFGKGEDVRKDKTFDATVKAINDFSDLASAGNPIDVMPWLRFFMPWKVSTCHMIAQALNDITRAKTEEHFASFCKDDIRDITDALIAADDQQLDEPINDSEMIRDRIHSMLRDLLLAGYETVATTTKWLLMCMAKYPEIQSRVQREIDDIVGSNRRVNISDRAYLPYTEATILEVLRWSCATPIALPHYTTKDTTLKGYDIDKNTVVMGNFQSVSFDETYWDEPHSLLPDRFLGPDGKLDGEKCSRNLPFGVGRRRCLGESLARVELFLIFTSLLQRWSFIEPCDDPVSLEAVPALVYRPKPSKLIVTERS